MAALVPPKAATRSKTLCPPVCIFVRPPCLPGRTSRSFVKLTVIHRSKFTHEALFRLYKRRQFPEFWDCRIAPEEIAECPLNLAVRLLTVHDDLDAAAALVDVWKIKHHASGVDVAAVIADADRLTIGVRAHYQRKKAKQMRAKQMDRKPTTRTRIVEEIQEQPGTPADIAFRLDLDRKAVGMQLQRLWKAGRIDRHESGIYSILGAAVPRPLPVVAMESSPTISRSSETVKPAERLTNSEIRRLYDRLQAVDETVGKARFGELLQNPDVGIKGIEEYIAGLET